MARQSEVKIELQSVANLPESKPPKRKAGIPRLRGGLYTGNEIITGEDPAELKAVKTAVVTHIKVD